MPATKAKPVSKSTEANLQRACTDILQLDGWRALRTDPVSDTAALPLIRKRIAAVCAEGHVSAWIVSKLLASVKGRGKGFGEEGMPDYLYIRYLNRAQVAYRSSIGTAFAVLKPPAAEVLYVEYKRPGGRVSPLQQTWHIAERQRGALTLVAGTDFEPTVNGFLDWYRKSGLARRDFSTTRA